MKPIVDICCGSRMFWFDKKNPDTVFCDKRKETHELIDKSSAGGKRTLIIDSELQCDFTSLPFCDNQFSLVVFDPPHLIKSGKTGWLSKKYGKLGKDWRQELSLGFAEAFRILKQNGVLIFKWCETDIPVSQIIPLSEAQPLIGHKSGKRQQTHWLVFMKP